MDSCAFEFFRTLGESNLGSIGLLFNIAALSGSAHQIKRVKFRPRMAEQLGKIRQSLAVLAAKGFSTVPDRPILTLFAKNSLLKGKGGCCWTRERGENEFRHASLTRHKVPHYPV